ncbi:MAG: hypothetical protein M1819_000784 [Sarea resinae]|nr:MAG: hypothetical protein M1819_000784 [Sarea resinae]
MEDAVVDMYEHLPVPYGLVRFGVAPDHPEVKNCQDKFNEVASSSRFNFIGNISVGTDLPLASLRPHYDAFLFAYGASQDRELGIPGETNQSVYSARAFVGWYNGLPEYASLDPTFDLTSRGEDAVLIGQGNVALDIARLLLTDIDVLRKTDITEQALDVLSKSRIKRVTIVGRRGPMQAAFTIKEVRELMSLPSVAFEPITPSLLPPAGTSLPRPQKRLLQLLQKQPSIPDPDASKSWSLRFLLSPLAFQTTPTSSPSHADELTSILFAQNALPQDAPFSPNARVTPTDTTTTLPASIAFRSIGYKSAPLPGFSDLNIPFDARTGIIPNDLHGRVLATTATTSSSSSSSSEIPGSLAARHVPGIYCAGWVKRGPTGVIASTMDDAFNTASVIASDWASRALFLNGPGRGVSNPATGATTTTTDSNNISSSNSEGSTGLGWDGVKAEADKLGLRRVSWADWQRIDAAERQRGRERGKEREKFASVTDMLAVLD